MPPHTKIDTLILSDMHLGAPVGKPRRVRDMLKRHNFKRLILLGDIFEGSKIDSLSEDDRALLSEIKKLAAQPNKIEVVIVGGNHDRRFHDAIQKLLGLPVREQYVWEYHGERFMALHGDQFDNFIRTHNSGHLDRAAHNLFLGIQRLDRNGRHLVKLLDYTNISLRRLSSTIAKRAIIYAKKNGASHIFCGHTHFTTHKAVKNGAETIHYHNTGCWTHTPSTYLAVDEGGKVLQGRYISTQTA